MGISLYEIENLVAGLKRTMQPKAG